MLKTLKNTIILLHGRQKVPNAYESGIFPKTKKGERLISILDHLLCLAYTAQASDRKDFSLKY